MKKRYKATKSDGVREKLQDCRYYLIEMRKCDPVRDTESLKRSISEFLAAFRTSVSRLNGVARTKLNPAAFAEFEKTIKGNSNIQLIRDRANEETHGDGALLWPLLVPSDRGGITLRPELGWQFPERRTNVVDLFSDALRDLEATALFFVRARLDVEPSSE